MKACDQLDNMFGMMAKNYLVFCIKPVLKDNNATLLWSNGTVCCEDDLGNDLTDEDWYKLLEYTTEQEFLGYLNKDCPPLWDILSCCENLDCVYFNRHSVPHIKG